MDRTANLITELICKGRMKHADLERLFSGRIEDEAILCTDYHKSYIWFAQNLGIELQQIKHGKHKEGIYNMHSILMTSIVNSRSGWISLMVLQPNTLRIILV